VSSREFKLLQVMQNVHETRQMSDVTSYPEHCGRFPPTQRNEGASSNNGWYLEKRRPMSPRR
jgi:hypothetical protein